MSVDRSAATPPRLAAVARETTAEHPWPLRLLSAKVGEYVAKMSALWVEGQVVQLSRRPGMSTAFLTLRDTDVDMSMSVTVSTRALDAMPAPVREGDHVVVHARPMFWPKRGTFQLQADQLRPVGVGELLARIEHLKRILAAEGLFDTDRKLALPFLPGTVGLVCGRESKAEHDVVVNARARWPELRFALRQVAVQGPRAVEEVCAAIAELDADPAVEVIVVARGGGSVEDLLPFSNETLVRAVAACRTPVVSAIGHETDTPLLDLVADYRASTPTAAARRVVPDVAEERHGLAQCRQRLRAAVTGRLRHEEHALAALRSRPCLADPHAVLEPRAQEVARLTETARRAVTWRLERAAGELATTHGRLVALSPAATLARGYAVLRTREGGVVRSAGQVTTGDRLEALLGQGRLGVEVVATSGGPDGAPGADHAAAADA